MSERTREEPGLTESEWSFLDRPIAILPSLSPTHSVEVVMPDTPACDTDTMTSSMTSTEPGKTSKRGGRGKELIDSTAKRGRAPNWRDDEKHALLMLKLEASVRGEAVTEGETWNVFVSNTLKERHGFDRAPKSCQQQSDTLKKQYDAIRLHDTTAACEVGGTSYWKMKDHERDALKLPHGFYVGWSILMESIMSCNVKKITSPTINLGSASDHVPAASDLASSSKVADVHMVPHSESTDVQPSEQKDFDMTNTQPPPSDMLAGDRELFLRVAPFVDKQIEDKIQPLVCGLLVREEDEQKYREKVLAMKLENLTLRRHRINSINMQCGSVVADDVKTVQSDRP